jgi:hypothetical protein
MFQTLTLQSWWIVDIRKATVWNFKVRRIWKYLEKIKWPEAHLSVSPQFVKRTCHYQPHVHPPCCLSPLGDRSLHRCCLTTSHRCLALSHTWACWGQISICLAISHATAHSLLSNLTASLHTDALPDATMPPSAGHHRLRAHDLRLYYVPRPTKKATSQCPKSSHTGCLSMHKELTIVGRRPSSSDPTIESTSSAPVPCSSTTCSSLLVTSRPHHPWTSHFHQTRCRRPPSFIEFPAILLPNLKPRGTSMVADPTTTSISPPVGWIWPRKPSASLWIPPLFFSHGPKGRDAMDWTPQWAWPRLTVTIVNFYSVYF